MSTNRIKPTNQTLIEQADEVVTISPAELTECMEKLVDLFGSAVSAHASARNGDKIKHSAKVRKTRAKLSQAIGILIRNQTTVTAM